MDARVARLAARLRPHTPAIAIAIAAIGLAWVFAASTLQHAHSFGLPLDDAYIYLTYAKQIGRGEPFSYYPGGGYSAGSTSLLWPVVLAPFWTLGARGHALVWVSFGICTALYAITCVASYRFVRSIAGQVAGLVAAALMLGVAPFAWTSLSGMEVAFASCLLVLTLGMLANTPPEGPPARWLAVSLAVTSLSRPEATMIVAGIVAVAVVNRLRRRELRAAAWWCAPLVAPLLWVVTNKLIAGHWFPNTGVAKSHFYLPGFDMTYWWTAVTTQTGRMMKALFWDATSPLVWPRLVALLWIVGAVRVVWWARRERRWLVGVLIVVAPFALVMSVIATSGQWSFQNYRYIAPAFPLWMLTAACALSPIKWNERWVTPARVAVAGLGVALFWRAAVPGMRADIALYAQNAVDLNTQVVTIGRYLHRKLPDATVMFHDAGAVAYFGDTRIYDMLGLVTNHQTQVANHGPGSRFEFLESLPPERRPTHFAYYPAWMGQGEFFGEVLLQTPLARQFAKRRLIGDSDMQVIVAVWDRAHTAERPLVDTAGWRVVDRVDVADIADERAHRWRGDLGRRRFADPTAKWSVFHKETAASGLVLDGGRTIRGKTETFTLRVEPHKPLRLVIRTGGKRDYPWHEPWTQPAKIEVSVGTGRAEATIAAPTGSLQELTLELLTPATHDLTVRVVADRPYRVFHWFALQPA